ncbi:MAG: hypothetical protein RJQ21_02330 [Rhodospirillales bacterium]
MRRLLMAILLSGLFYPIAAGAESPPTSIIDGKVISQIREVLARPVVTISVQAQNRYYGQLSADDIDKLDKQWRSERESDDQPLIGAVMSSPLSTYLTLVQAQSQGLYSEVFVMDRNGLNVGQGAVTSDFWQGDEAKFQKSFGVGPDAVFIDEPEFNEEFKTWRAQVNLTIVHDGEKIGAATFEINLTELARRQAAQ